MVDNQQVERRAVAIFGPFPPCGLYGLDRHTGPGGYATLNGFRRRNVHDGMGDIAAGARINLVAPVAAEISRRRSSRRFSGGARSIARSGTAGQHSLDPINIRELWAGQKSTVLGGPKYQTWWVTTFRTLRHKFGRLTIKVCKSPH
jgi:hypothetical protein